MVKWTVLYEHPDDPDAFEYYYTDTHTPMVRKIPNLLRYEATKAVATPDGSEDWSAPPYYRVFEEYFQDMERLQGGMSSSERQAAFADIPNFATGGATIFISEIDA